MNKYKPRPWEAIAQTAKKLRAGMAAAIAFYTCLPVPLSWTLEFRGIARFAPLVGLGVGALLALFDALLHLLDMPILTRSVLIVGIWIAITGGLHLDGAMDTADGLAVQDPQRRLEVMADSRTGAFGTIAAIAIILLKTAALNDLDSSRAIALMAAATWGRWGQLVAIARYPYLKATGKGAFHKESMHSPWDLLPGLAIAIALSVIQGSVGGGDWSLAIGMASAGSAIAILTGAWFNQQLGGHTGDTYGAVVEWTEALLLCVLAGF
ncbi:adenosylcobinamide-GDP ribazoletransferase [Oxynema sp. CENA135]|uniref:adenosylcobinamide-GDP ribazoletransferase n=1 Tax=Oxynema sp. CENA135 TaxID=984206 RepID=UPI001F1FF6A8|nr:adenosylcobinamide-GDP ribazoletransferase [Oxynema sp. CENA135]